MKTLRALLASTVLAVVAPAPAHALTSIDFGVQCTPGAFRACASVDIWTAVNSSGWTSLFVEIANVQGRPGFEELPIAGLGGFLIDGLSYDCTPSALYMSGGEPFPCYDFLQDRGFDHTTGDHPISIDGGGEYGLNHNEFIAWQSDPGGDDINAGYLYGDDDEAYGWGCDIPAGAESHSFSTCTSPARIEFNFGPETHLGITEDTGLLLWFAPAPFAQGTGARCATSPPLRFFPSSSDVNDQCIRVPEPRTLPLLITGLLGIVALGRRRAPTDAP